MFSKLDHPPVSYADYRPLMDSKLADDLRAGDLVVCLGAGDITQWAAGLADGIARASTA